MTALVPTILDSTNPDAYGIRYNEMEHVWEAVAYGEIIARRNTAKDAEAALVGRSNDDEIVFSLADLGVSDLIGQPAWEPGQVHLPTAGILVLIMVLGLACIFGVYLIVHAIVTHL